MSENLSAQETVAIRTFMVEAIAAMCRILRRRQMLPPTPTVKLGTIFIAAITRQVIVDRQESAFV